MDQTAEDTETFLAYHQPQEKTQTSDKVQNGAGEKKEETPDKNSLRIIKELNEDCETPERPMFVALERSQLPPTAKVESILSKELKSVTLDENHFMLSVPDHNNPHGIKIKVYLFGTKECVPLHISSKEKVVDVIRHLITVTKNEQKDPQAYELRLIDDDEDYYVPFYEISALEPNDPVGEFTALALCKNKSYQPPKPATVSDIAALGRATSVNTDVYTVFIKLPFLESRVDLEIKDKKATLSDLLKKINKKYEIDLRENMYCFRLYSEDNFELKGDNIDSLGRKYIYRGNEYLL